MWWYLFLSLPCSEIHSIIFFLWARTIEGCYVCIWCFHCRDYMHMANLPTGLGCSVRSCCCAMGYSGTTFQTLCLQSHECSVAGPSCALLCGNLTPLCSIAEMLHWSIICSVSSAGRCCFEEAEWRAAAASCCLLPAALMSSIACWTSGLSCRHSWLCLCPIPTAQTTHPGTLSLRHIYRLIGKPC